ncbi:MAG: shikimate dehydrogenase [Chloroflexi bacterium]|nr:shikimate dehydrogenase [Chloroflexota bacterium]
MPAESKLVFIGVSTGGSSIMRIFPRWSEVLGLNCAIVGIDLPLRAPAASYRRVLQDIIADPAAKGALITAHKIDMLRACRDQIDALDAYARICDEVSCVIKQEGKLLGFAKDPISSAQAQARFVPRGHWRDGARDALCLGAGGAAVAISVCLARADVCDQPRRFILTDIAPERLESIQKVHRRLDTPLQFEYHLSASAADNDRLLRGLAPGSLVINATGLGKDKPGSPLSSRAQFPQDGLIWELNYRGARDFMRQAAAQAAARNLTVEDGWRYFVHGWTEVIAEVFNLELDSETFAKLSAAASASR